MVRVQYEVQRFDHLKLLDRIGSVLKDGILN